MSYTPVMSEVIRELVLEIPSPYRHPPSTVSQRVTGLNHELGNNTVKDDALKITTSCMPHKVFHCFRCLHREQTDVDVTHGGVNDGGGSNGRWTPFTHGSCCGDALLFSGRSFVEDIAISNFAVPIK